MRYLNKVVEEPKKVLMHWYRVAIMYNSDQNFYYTKVINKPHHHVMIEGEVNFVRWETPVEYIA
jgi:hypothetical protein